MSPLLSSKNLVSNERFRFGSKGAFSPCLFSMT